MCVDETDAPVVQASSLNRWPHLAHLRHPHLWLKVQQRKRLSALLQRASVYQTQGKFRNDERMDHNVPLVKMLAQFSVSGTEMVDPNRRIGENQFGRTRRRGIFFNCGIVPPRDANLRALSRSMRALRASRTNAVFSATPVNSWAMRTRSSSSARVVLIGTPGTNLIALNDVILCACICRVTNATDLDSVAAGRKNSFTKWRLVFTIGLSGRSC